MSRFLGFRSRTAITHLLFLAFSCGILFGCAKKVRSDPAPLSQWVPIRLADREIEVQIALKTEEMARGLMFRESLGENRGMLFFYHLPKQMSFWMRNTKVALDIGFFTADGILREVYSMYPMDERSVKSRRDDLLIALEMNQGWYAKNGIKIGEQLDLIILKEALMARGEKAQIIPF
tara:strand:+ start:2817 stop:3347 length:531 start_codon:yes stop_codon:yes gene_type:complete